MKGYSKLKETKHAQSLFINVFHIFYGALGAQSLGSFLIKFKLLHF